MKIKCYNCNVEFSFVKKDIKIIEEIRRKDYNLIGSRTVYHKDMGLSKNYIIKEEYFWFCDVSVVKCRVCKSDIELFEEFKRFAHKVIA